MAYGNTSVSSLISGETAARNKQTSINDQAAAYQYQTSAQTADDYSAYNEYLSGRLGATTDPSQKMTIQSKLTSAYSSYTSNEIQRQSQNVMAGEEDNRTKLASIGKMIDQANSVGDANLAQNLVSQYMSLTKTIQSEDAASASKALAQSKKNVNQALSQQDVALATAERAARTGKPLSDDKGNQFKLDPTTGQFTQAAPGEKGDYVTARQLQLATTLNYLNKADIYRQAQAGGLDDNGEYTQKLADLEANPNYITATSPETISALKDPSGDQAFAMTYNPTTKLLTPTVRSATGFDASGKPTYSNGFSDITKTGQAGPLDTTFTRRVDATNPNSPLENYIIPTAQVRSAPDASNPNGVVNPYERNTQDPVTKGIDYTSIDTKSPLYSGGKYMLHTKDGSLQFSKDDEQAGKAPNYLAAFGSTVLDPNTYTPELKGLADTLLHPSRIVNGIGSFLDAGATQNIANQVNTHAVQQTWATQVALAQANARAAQAAAAVRNMPVVNPARVVTSNPNGTLNNVVGPRAVPAAVTAAQNTVGTPQFTQSMFPNVTLPQNTTLKSSPGPQNTSNWWNPTSWFK